MVWYDMVCDGVVWYGMVWYGMIWYDTVWYGKVQRGVRCTLQERYGMVGCRGVCGRDDYW